VRKLILFLSSNAGLGYAPFASGTFGTLAGIPIFYLISDWPWWLFLVTFTALLFLSFWVADAAGLIYGVADDGRIVIDELIGYLVTVAFLPWSWPVALLGFFWFRLFDILKPQPARWLDRNLKHGVGVVLDDFIAGIYGALALRLTLWLFNLG
jgi:phosphatidylglycerophosphatase A